MCCWLRACSFNPCQILKDHSTSLFHTVKDMSVGLISERIEKQQSVKISCFNVSLQQVQISSVKRCLFFQVQEKAVALTDRINTPSAYRSLWFLIAECLKVSHVKVFSDVLVLLYLWIYIYVWIQLSVTSQGLPRHTYFSFDLWHRPFVAAPCFQMLTEICSSETNKMFLKIWNMIKWVLK